MPQHILKYEKEIEHLLNEGCVLPNLHLIDKMEACRFASSLPNAQNHIPQYMTNPKRMLSDITNNKATTSLLALSCFVSDTKAEKFFLALKKSNPRAVQSIGDSLSEGVLTQSDGEVTTPTPNGHFDLYEYVGCDLNKSFKITRKL